MYSVRLFRTAVSLVCTTCSTCMRFLALPVLSSFVYVCNRIALKMSVLCVHVAYCARCFFTKSHIVIIF